MVPRLTEVFLVKESPKEEDPRHWGMPESSRENLKRFLEKHSDDTVRILGKDIVDLAAYLMFVDDWEGPLGLRAAIVSGDESKQDKISAEILNRFPPEEYDPHASKQKSQKVTLH